MAIKYGYFPSNSSEGITNEYTGFDFNTQLKYLLSDGVFATPQGTPSNYLQVLASGGTTLTIKAGAGNFFDTWFVADADETLTLDNGSGNDRIDVIVVEVNKNPTVLASSLKIIKGTPTTVPVAPTLINTDYVKQYALAHVRVLAGTAVISQSYISDKRGTTACPWVTNLVSGSVDISTILTQFETAYWSWYNDVSQHLGNLIMRRYWNNYVTTAINESVITVPINEYDPILDILNVYVEGRLFKLDVEYTRTDNVVTFMIPFPQAGTVITFEIFKAIDGTGAVTYVERLEALETTVDSLPLLNSDSIVVAHDVLTECLVRGVGLYTVQSAAGKTNNPLSDVNFRGLSSFTSITWGYVLLFSNNGDAFVNIYNSAWSGWRKLYESGNNFLYKGTAWLGSNQTIIPTKPLSECANGWIVTFSKVVSGAGVDDYINSIIIPKTAPTGNNWNGEYMCVEIPYNFSVDGQTKQTAFKRFRVYNNRIVGEAQNYTATNYTVGLRLIKEF